MQSIVSGAVAQSVCEDGEQRLRRHMLDDLGAARADTQLVLELAVVVQLRFQGQLEGGPDWKGMLLGLGRAEQGECYPTSP